MLGDFGYFFVRVIAVEGSHFENSLSQRNTYFNFKVDYFQVTKQ